MNKRSCVICKKKDTPDQFFRFIILHAKGLNEIIIDINHKIPTYGFYYCRNNPSCERGVLGWLSKKKKNKSLRGVLSNYTPY